MSMSVCGEEQTPNNERETKTVLNIELLFTRLDLIRTRNRAHVEKGIAAVAVMVWPVTQELPAEKGAKDK